MVDKVQAQDSGPISSAASAQNTLGHDRDLVHITNAYSPQSQTCSGEFLSLPFSFHR
jgi:hypothetical protein